MLNNDPDWDPALFAGRARLYYGRWTYKYESAAPPGRGGRDHHPHHPVGRLPVAGGADLVERRAVRAAGRGRAAPAARSLGDRGRRAPAAGARRPRPRRARRRGALARLPPGAARDPRPRSRSTSELHRVETANVLGLLPGSRPAARRRGRRLHRAPRPPRRRRARRDRRHDLQRRRSTTPSGCAQVLAVARAFAALPSARAASILVAFVAAEEQGLLGLGLLRAAPHLPARPDRRQHQLRRRQRLRAARATSTLVGYGKSTLDGIVERRGRASGARGDRRPDARAGLRSTARTSSASRAIGVPALYLDAGADFIGTAAGLGRGAAAPTRIERCYHQPCDEFDADWNLDGMVEDARLAFGVGLEIANADEMPAWNPGDEFERRAWRRCARRPPGSTERPGRAGGYNRTGRTGPPGRCRRGQPPCSHRRRPPP